MFSILGKTEPPNEMKGLIMHLQVSLYTFRSVQVHLMVTGKKRRQGLKGEERVLAFSGFCQCRFDLAEKAA